jgi:hypothetical protein
VITFALDWETAAMMPLNSSQSTPALVPARVEAFPRVSTHGASAILSNISLNTTIAAPTYRIPVELPTVNLERI